MRDRAMIAWLLPLAALAPVVVQADSMQLEPLTVTAPRVERELIRTPQAVSTVLPEDVQEGRQGLQLDESLNRVPGVFTQNRYNFAQNLRLSVRGFGARAPFGIRGIRVFVDGIPETLPDGQSQVDMIDLESVERMEVLRGPSSALYGNATGGVLDIHTMDGPATPYMELRGAAGSDDFRRVGVRGGGQTGPWNYHLSGWDLAYDGFRDQSATEKRLVNGKLRYDLDEHRSLTAVLTVLDQPLGEDPGGLTRQQARENRRGANPNAEALDAGQEVEQRRLGILYRDADPGGGTLQARAFYTQRDFRQQLPFPGPSLVAFDRDFYGVGVDYGNRTDALPVPLRYQVGVEVEEQRDDRERFRVTPGGDVTSRTQDERQKATSIGVFSQAELELSRRLDWTVAGRFDRVRFRIDDRLQQNGDQSGSRTFDEISLATGLNYLIHPDHALYTSVGTSYETPTFTEFARIGEQGGFNPDIEPQRAVNVEVGVKGFLATTTRYELALFSVRTRDEIVNVQTDQNEYSNAARTRRYGIELGLEHFFNDNLSASVAYTVSDFRFRGFEDDDGNDFRGNRLPGLPKQALFAELAWREAQGAYAIVDGLVAGRVFADNANEVEVSGYAVVNARVGTVQSMGRSEVETFVGVNNLLDRDYFSNIRINASGGQYFEPAPGRNVHAGVRARF